jgi:hypothetical protein
MNEKYLVLSDSERDKGYVRPYRESYKHERKEPAPGSLGCGGVTRMAPDIAATYARQPDFYGSTYCVHCQKHRPVTEFVWVDDGEVVGS